MTSTKCTIEDALQKTVATGMFEHMLCDKLDLEQLAAKTGSGQGWDDSWKRRKTGYGGWQQGNKVSLKKCTTILEGS